MDTKISLIIGAAALSVAGLWTAGTAPGSNAASVSPRVSSPGNSTSSRDPVVLELFTSQSCSSCPPADALAAKLVRDPKLVVITRPVTYWDRLGWKDTLGRPENTALQRAYARKKNQGSGVYTPQIVVDGRHGAVGSSEAKIRGLIAASARLPAPEVSVSSARGGGYTITLSGPTDAPAQIALVALDRSETVGIGNGENRGRTITYTNVVRDEDVIGRWNGGSASFTVKPSQLEVKGANRYAVLVQQTGAGAILTGRYLK